MSEVITGVIDSITTQTVNTKNGPKPVYHAMVNGMDVNLGFQTTHIKGENVAFHVEHKYGGYQLLSTPAPAGTPAATDSPFAASGSAAPAGNSPARTEFPVAINSRGTSITRQNSMGHAARVVRDMRECGVVVFATSEEYIAKVIEVAYEITDFSTGQREAKAAAAQAVLDGND